MTFGELHAVLEWAVEGENFHVPVIVRLCHKVRDDVPMVADCTVTACAVEEISKDTLVREYRLVLDIDNPLE